MADIMTQDIKNQIKKIINDFCLDQNYDNLRLASANSFLACMSLIGKNVFRQFARGPKKKNIINLADIEQVQEVYDFYKDICLLYNKEISIDSFSMFSGISKAALYSWKNEKSRTVIYLDINNNIIEDINYYKNINKNNIDLINGIREVVNSKHKEFIKNIYIDQELSLSNIGINDRNNTGVAMKLNSKFNWNSLTGQETSEKKQALIEAADLKNDLKMLD